jgi:hypothetical protein
MVDLFKAVNVLDDREARMIAWARQAVAIVLVYTHSADSSSARALSSNSSAMVRPTYPCQSAISPAIGC